MLSDEELKEIESGKVPEGPKATPAEYGLKELRDILASDCGWAVDELYDRSEALLAEVKRLCQLVYAHDTNGAPECYAIDPPPIKRES